MVSAASSHLGPRDQSQVYNQTKSGYSTNMSEGSGGKKKVNQWVVLIAGSISGGIECICVWPMEFIKTQLQLQKKVAGVKPPYTGNRRSLLFCHPVCNF